MKSYHWGCIVLFLVIGYALGIFWPNAGIAVRTKIGV